MERGREGNTFITRNVSIYHYSVCHPIVSALVDLIIICSINSPNIQIYMMLPLALVCE